MPRLELGERPRDDLSHATNVGGKQVPRRQWLLRARRESPARDHRH